jgi:hypothetical protein
LNDDGPPYAAPLSERVVQRTEKAVSHEPERVQKVALSGTVRPDQEGHLSERQ